MEATTTKDTETIEAQVCFNCATTRDREEMGYCLVCGGYACINCSCNCNPEVVAVNEAA